MAGIYIHVPFCKQKCNYCDFYSVAQISKLDTYLNAVIKEIKLKSFYFSTSTVVETIYFGGGTPSLLSIKHIELIIKTLQEYFNISGNAEITLEVNPDDISAAIANDYKSLGINRVSIGIQSSNDDELVFLKRRHSFKNAVEAVDNFIHAGIENISVDLIYGLPGSDCNKLRNTLEIFASLNVKHISAYHLTYEKGTALHLLKEKKRFKIIDEYTSSEMFFLVNEILFKHNFEMYEISNFAKKGFESKHNSNYWKLIPYLGFGPSAHSYCNNIRFWNDANLNNYIKNIESESCFFQEEEIDEVSRFNEYIMISLRTREGLDKKYLHDNFSSRQVNRFYKALNKYRNSEYLYENDDNIALTLRGMFISDSIISNLFA